MCGRFQLLDDQEIDEINKIISEVQMKAYLADGSGGTEPSAAVKFGEIYPTNFVPVVVQRESNLVSSADREENKRASLEIMRWGFPIGKNAVINARAETAHEKKMFKGTLQNGRCVIPSTGFFEWTHYAGKSKDKLLFNLPGQRMLYMAGVSGKLPVKNGEGPTGCFVILTRAANQYMADVHDRMPVILHKSEILRWLADEAFADYVMQRETIVLVRKPA